MQLTYKRALAIFAATLFSLLFTCIWFRQSPAQGVTISLPNVASTAASIVIIDPGHGGNDPGAHGLVRGHEVYEAPYVADVALRAARHVRKLGGAAILTRVNARTHIVDNHPQVILPLARDDKFRDGSTVRARSSGMERRIAVAREALRKHPRKQVVFVSIHFDAERTALLRGAYVIAPNPAPATALRLVDAFQRHHRERSRKTGSRWDRYVPLLVNGKVRNLYILRKGKNPAQERVLVELGNFKNPDDLYRIRDPKVREQYARLIAEAIMNSAARR